MRSQRDRIFYLGYSDNFSIKDNVIIILRK